MFDTIIRRSVNHAVSQCKSDTVTKEELELVLKQVLKEILNSDQFKQDLRTIVEK